MIGFEKTCYSLEGSVSLTIAVIADLHEADGRQIVSMLERTPIDLILLPGDILERHDPEPRRSLRERYVEYRQRHRFAIPKFIAYYIGRKAISVARITFRAKNNRDSSFRGVEFLQAVARIAPCYYSIGNHECDLSDDERKQLEKLGIVVLDDEFVRRDGVIIGGLSSPKRRNYIAKREGRNAAFVYSSGMPNVDWLDRFENEKGFHILLSHHPEHYDRYIKEKNIELVVSGHAHGGQIRINNRGLYSPGQGFFPKLTKGIYDQRLIVSAGTSNNMIVPRINNPKEIVIIKINRKE